MSKENQRDVTIEELVAAGNIRNAEKKFHNGLYEANNHRGDDPGSMPSQVHADVWVDGVIASVERRRMYQIAAEFGFVIGHEAHEMESGQNTVYDSSHMIYEFYDTFGNLRGGEEVVILSSGIAQQTDQGLEIVLLPTCIRPDEDHLVGDSTVTEQSPRFLKRTRVHVKNTARE